MEEEEAHGPAWVVRLQKARAVVYNTLDEPSTSSLAFAAAILIFAAILLSAVSFCLETVPELRDWHGWPAIEILCIVIFTAEFMGRLVTCPNLWAFVKTPMNIIDAIAILPWYIEIGLDADSNIGSNLILFRLARLTRVFRVMKLTRYSVSLRLVGRALRSSVDALVLLAFFILIALVIFSSGVYYAEKMGETWSPELRCPVRDDGLCNPFTSIPHTFWWCITTLTTVGYGDEVPRTVAGRIIAGICMLTGLLILALPTSILGTSFMQERQAVREQAMMRMNAVQSDALLGRKTARKWVPRGAGEDPASPKTRAGAATARRAEGVTTRASELVGVDSPTPKSKEGAQTARSRVYVTGRHVFGRVASSPSPPPGTGAGGGVADVERTLQALEGYAGTLASQLQAMESALQAGRERHQYISDLVAILRKQIVAAPPPKDGGREAEGDGGGGGGALSSPEDPDGALFP
eukprot:tig00001254_g7820.t1